MLSPVTRSLLVGVIGHVDHGKTALVRALTGVETDRLKEEQARGVSIVPGFALLRTADGEIDLVDLPGHERFVRAMIAGATGMRAVLLAVDVREGVRPQTLEHLAIANLIGVTRGVIALTKCDGVEPAVVAARMREVAAAAARAGLADAAAVATSARTGAGIPELAAALDALLANVRGAVDDGFPYLPVDRVFARPGFGCVVTGTLRRGRLAVGDAVAIQPGGRTATVRSLQIHGRSVSEAAPGRRTAVALRGVELAGVARGQALVAPGLTAEGRWLDVSLRALPDAPPLAGGSTLRLLVGTAEVPVRLRLLDRDTLAPGESAVAQLHAANAVAAPAREPFILRSDAPSATVAGGRVLDPVSRRRRRHDGRVLADLERLAGGQPAAALAVALGQGDAVRFADLLPRVGVAPDRVRRQLAATGAREVGERVIGAAPFAALREAALTALTEHHRTHPLEHGLPADRLARSLAADDILVTAALRDLAATRDVVQTGPLFRRADFDPGRQETPQVRALAQAFREGGLAPPDEAAAVGRDIRRQEALSYLVAEGIVIRALDRVQKRTVLFHRDAIARARQDLAAAFPDATTPEMGFLAREAGASLGISRKFSIPLLEHLDKVGFTRRAGDRRYLAAGKP